MVGGDGAGFLGLTGPDAPLLLLELELADGPEPELLTVGPPLALVAPAWLLLAGCVAALLVVPFLTVNCLKRPGLNLTSPVEMLISTKGLATSRRCRPRAPRH